MPKVVCIVQARCGSTRLPNKILKEVCGKPLLAHDIERLKYAKRVHEVVIATSFLEQDDAVYRLATQNGVRCFRGDEQNVLSRYYGAAQMAEADIIVRVTSDCPLIDPVTIDEVVAEFLKGDCDYVSTPVPVKYPRGVDAEVFSFDALQRAMRLAKSGPDTEHVTYGMYTRPEVFRCKSYEGKPELIRPQYRLCVDTEEDLRLIQALYQRLYTPGEIVPIEAVIKLLDREPKLAAINATVQQKHV